MSIGWYNGPSGISKYLENEKEIKQQKCQQMSDIVLLLSFWLSFGDIKAPSIYTSRQILWLAQCLGSNNKQWLALFPLMQSGRSWTFFFCVHWNHFVWQCYFVIHNLLATWKPFTLYILSEGIHPKRTTSKKTYRKDAHRSDYFGIVLPCIFCLNLINWFLFSDRIISVRTFVQELISRSVHLD